MGEGEFLFHQAKEVLDHKIAITLGMKHPGGYRFAGKPHVLVQVVQQNDDLAARDNRKLVECRCMVGLGPKNGVTGENPGGIRSVLEIL